MSPLTRVYIYRLESLPLKQTSSWLQPNQQSQVKLIRYSYCRKAKLEIKISNPEERKMRHQYLEIERKEPTIVLYSPNLAIDFANDHSTISAQFV